MTLLGQGDCGFSTCTDLVRDQMLTQGLTFYWSLSWLYIWSGRTLLCNRMYSLTHTHTQLHINISSTSPLPDIESHVFGMLLLSPSAMSPLYLIMLIPYGKSNYFTPHAPSLLCAFVELCWDACATCWRTWIHRHLRISRVSRPSFQLSKTCYRAGISSQAL